MTRPTNGTYLQRTELFFGLGEADGHTISDVAFQIFVRDVVTPRFPDGLTVIAGYGQWRDDHTGRINAEPCRVMILLHPIDTGSDRRIEQIRTAYESQFRQQSVLQTDDFERISF